MNTVTTRSLRFAGGLLLVIGIQAWIFQSMVATQSEDNLRRLNALIEEVPSHTKLNQSLATLRDLHRASRDSSQRQKIIVLRDTLINQFASAPGATIKKAIQQSSELQGTSDHETTLLQTLHDALAGLRDIYIDDGSNALSAYLRAPIYLQPTASLLALNGETRDRLEINESIYLLLVGDRDAALLLLDELRRDVHPTEIRSKALFVLSRLKFDEFRASGSDEHFRQARDLTRLSLSLDPKQDLPKLFLEYLLSLDAEAVEIDSEPEEGQGTGESEGERGAISSGVPEH